MAIGKSRVVAVYNPVKIGEERLRTALTERSRKHGWTDPLLIETTEEDPGKGMAEEAVAEGAGLVLAIGGDGTVRNVAAGLSGTGIPMGIIPCGTGNLLARNLDLPLEDLDGALRVAMSGSTKHIDLGRVTYTDENGDEHSDVFLVMFGVGLDADLITGTDENLKKRVGTIAYVSSFVRTVLFGHRIRVEYGIDGEPAKYAHTRSVLVGNCGVLQAGMVLMPDAEIDDGLLDVIVLQPKGVIGWLRASWSVLIRNKILRHSEAGRKILAGPVFGALRSGKGARVLDFRQGTQAKVTVLHKPAAFQIDGDGLGLVQGFTTTMRRGGLAVRVPN